MILMNGTNDFCGRFDYFRWSAPVCEDSAEVLSAANNLQCHNKTVRYLSAIGSAWNVGGIDKGLLQHRLRLAGLDPRTARRESSALLDAVLLPCEAELREPLQIVFTDGTTLELLPTERGGARIGESTVPAGLTAGLNASDLDAQMLFGQELTGLTFQGLTVQVLREDAPGKQDNTQYRILLAFSGGYRLELITETHRYGYVLRLCQQETVLEVPYGRVRSSLRPVPQIRMLPGYRSGGYVRITPVYIPDPAQKTDWIGVPQADFALSMEDDLCREFLGTLLDRHFNSAVQYPEPYRVPGFDWYGVNRYTMEATDKLLADIRNSARLLSEDYDCPELEQIKRRYCVHSFGYPDDKLPLSDAESAAFIRQNIRIAIDFYHRFADRLEAIMRHCGNCNMIVFSGP